MIWSHMSFRVSSIDFHTRTTRETTAVVVPYWKLGSVFPPCLGVSSATIATSDATMNAGATMLNRIMVLL